MVRLVLSLIPLSFLISMPITALLVRLGHSMGTFDSPGVEGQVKAQRRRVPNTGGIAVFVAIALPIMLGTACFRGIDASAGADWRNDFTLLPADTHEHVAGIQQQTPLAMLLVGSLLLLHVLGLIDDRRPLGPFLKLAIMAIPAFGVPLVTTLSPNLSATRLLTFLDAYSGGPWLSIVLTGVWFLVVTNAMNFIDNMDGLSAGVAAIAGSCFLAAVLIQGQWFVGACLALVVGAAAGFLVFNFPWRASRGARIFLGDGGSIVLGFLLAFLTVRTTYLPPTHSPETVLADGTVTSHAAAATPFAWYAVFMPLAVLAIPIYDFLSVSSIRIAHGRSPFVGDLNHLSHRLVRRGLSNRNAVLVIYGFTAISGFSGIILGSLAPWQALLAGTQIILMLLVLGIFEYATSKGAP